MPWYAYLLLVIGPLAVIAVVFLALHLVTRLTGRRGIAPGWQLRCTRCGKVRDASEAGMIRIGAASYKKFTLGYCRHCRSFRWIAVERKPESAENHATPAASA